MRRSAAHRCLILLASPLAGLALLFAPSCSSSAFAQQVTLTTTRNLDFGRFAAGGGGAVSIDGSGVRTKSGSVILLNSSSAGPAQFTVSSNGNGGKGGGNKSVVISLPADGSTRLASGTASMAVNAFVASPNALLSIPAGGITMSVGASLTVAPNQAPGNYSGSFSLIVNYQ